MGRTMRMEGIIFYYLLAISDVTSQWVSDISLIGEHPITQNHQYLSISRLSADTPALEELLFWWSGTKCRACKGMSYVEQYSICHPLQAIWYVITHKWRKANASGLSGNSHPCRVCDMSTLVDYLMICQHVWRIWCYIDLFTISYDRSILVEYLMIFQHLFSIW